LTIIGKVPGHYSIYTDAEVLAFLETGWGIGSISDLQLSFLYGQEDDQ
tara:strand:+ start:2339 stop:2482 length:144 start_codon:yes stop_codon:yes gene_type:complete